MRVSVKEGSNDDGRSWQKELEEEQELEEDQNKAEEKPQWTEESEYYHVHVVQVKAMCFLKVWYLARISLMTMQRGSTPASRLAPLLQPLIQSGAAAENAVEGVARSS